MFEIDGVDFDTKEALRLGSQNSQSQLNLLLRETI